VNLEVKVVRITVETEDDVKKYGFFGSPTVRINGLDIDPTVRQVKDFGFT